MSYFEILYSRASTLARDLFQYLFGGVFFVWLLAVVVVFEDGLETVERWNRALLPTLVSPDGASAPAVVVAIILLYLAGQLLYSLSSMIFWVYGKIGAVVGRIFGGGPTPRLQRLERNLSERFLREMGGDTPLGGGLPCHLYFEMLVFLRAPELHARFVERYNSLVHMRRTLSSCMFFAGLCGLAYLGPGPGGLAWSGFCLGLSVLLYWNYLESRVGFLERVAAGTMVADERGRDALERT
jgi:hypothetical protein